MVITGSVIGIKPGSYAEIENGLKRFPDVTLQAVSPSGCELVVNFEAESIGLLEDLCDRIKSSFPEVIDISHVYVNMEDEVEKFAANLSDPEEEA
jgi:nitrate reductase NapAB chaperone NapD